ncbi:MAG: HPF/RaiA family ribosome-associated protein [Deltaproteobacteria bacterium]|nr:HPF/RaiA family ribosome-associated protein [Deltaproteobacteria bacterium]
MEMPLQITFRNMPHSPAIEENVREKAGKLDSYYDRIMSCRVVVEAPHRRHHKGKAYHVRIDLTVPGGELVINRAPKRLNAAKLREPDLADSDLTETHEPSKHSAHEDVYVAIRDAFNSAARKLQNYARKRRGEVKLHDSTPLARVSKVYPEESYGFLETADGRDIYFHKNSVLQPGFDHLEVGTEVHFAEEVGDKGPQASTVRIAGK